MKIGSSRQVWTKQIIQNLNIENRGFLTPVVHWWHIVFNTCLLDSLCKSCCQKIYQDSYCRRTCQNMSIYVTKLYKKLKVIKRTDRLKGAKKNNTGWSECLVSLLQKIIKWWTLRISISNTCNYNTHVAFSGFSCLEHWGTLQGNFKQREGVKKLIS